MNIKQAILQYNKDEYIKHNNELLSTQDGVVSDSTTTTVNTINLANNCYSNCKSDKKYLFSIPHIKNEQNIKIKYNNNIHNINIYSKGKIIKATENKINHFVINKKINIKRSNNNLNLNKNIISNDNKGKKNGKEINRSMSLINIKNSNSSFNNKNYYINKDSFRVKHLLFNKKKICPKNYINANNNSMNISNNKKNHLLTHNNNEFKHIKRDNNEILNIEEILMLEEKLSSLINCLINKNTCIEESFEYIYFYSTTKLSININRYFLKEKYLQIIKRAMNLKIFSFIICYDLSLNENIFQKFISLLSEIFSCIHKILILISNYFCNNIIENNSNIWVKKLENLIQKYDFVTKNQNKIFDEIDILCNKLKESLYPLLFQKYKKYIVLDIYNRIDILTQDDLQKLYKEKIYVNMNINGSIIGSSSYFEENKNFLNSLGPIPYLKNKSDKKYTLVLDLDETLIHFKVNPNNDSSGTLLFRPFITEFLSNISKLYELVVFTAATQDYADPIIDAIELKGTKFEYRLYRMHTIVINNDFIKDLSRLGRDLSNIIIVDNMEQNYKLQPDNGITIRPFWGKDVNDMALFDLLSILTSIAKKNMDVRDGINLFKEDIISRVTSNIFRRIQY